jgi:hypothetical protein
MFDVLARLEQLTGVFPSY